MKDLGVHRYASIWPMAFGEAWEPHINARPVFFVILRVPWIESRASFVVIVFFGFPLCSSVSSVVDAVFSR